MSNPWDYLEILLRSESSSHAHTSDGVWFQFKIWRCDWQHNEIIMRIIPRADLASILALSNFESKSKEPDQKQYLSCAFKLIMCAPETILSRTSRTSKKTSARASNCGNKNRTFFCAIRNSNCFFPPLKTILSAAKSRSSVDLPMRRPITVRSQTADRLILCVAIRSFFLRQTASFGSLLLSKNFVPLKNWFCFSRTECHSHTTSKSKQFLIVHSDLADNLITFKPI